MKFDPNARNRTDRTDREKQDRTAVVYELPGRARHGTHVVYIDAEGRKQFCTWTGTEWFCVGVTAPVTDTDEDAEPSEPEIFYSSTLGTASS